MITSEQWLILVAQIKGLRADMSEVKKKLADLVNTKKQKGRDMERRMRGLIKEAERQGVKLESNDKTRRTRQRGESLPAWIESQQT